jgi:hypothetical protein
MSFHYDFFSETVRYVSACGQLPTLELTGNMTNICDPNQNEANITWGVLQSVVAFAVWVSSALVGLRAKKGSSAILPSTVSFFFLVSMIAHGVASGKNWTLGFYGEVGCWVGAFILALLLFSQDLERISLWSFNLVAIAGLCCMIAEYSSEHSVANLNNSSLIAIFAIPLVAGAVLGVFFGRTQKSRQFMYIFAGSICQAILVTPLTFAAQKFDGCPVLWRYDKCHQDSKDAALAVTIATFVGSAVIGLVVQFCWAYHQEREQDRGFVNPDLHHHIAGFATNDIMGDDLAARSVLNGQKTRHLDNRWNRMTSGAAEY